MNQLYNFQISVNYLILNNSRLKNDATSDFPNNHSNKPEFFLKSR